MAGPSNVFDSQRGKITPLFSILGSQCFTVGGGGGQLFPRAPIELRLQISGAISHIFFMTYCSSN